MRLTGFDAIDYAERMGLTLNQPASCTSSGHRISISEAEAIAATDPQRIWLIVPDNAYGFRHDRRCR
jgi:hypothetical protein